ncbi:PIG-L family deacetylase [Hufsiella ginkgonis]|uniref:LmbE family protein n=1 Tax=Hufsiella ginkgonis TaxID=2695274 RepID=A0A7K1XTQ8_9SPHI|nr:PIG-L family deacetylase [Hufsiella ginkgonis]MXV14362.1 LmbE family protein [Hufsiella ginkgonis]
MKPASLFFAALLLSTASYSQTVSKPGPLPPALGLTSPQLNAAEIKLALKKLDVVGSVLYVAAHPDDENTRLLSWLAKEKLYRTGYLSLTRGDGGQNLIGNEQSEQLGLIRTQELLAARRMDGAEQFFTRANDFGFSKTAGETLRIWNKEHILADIVWVIRKFRPDVIITRFTDDARAGHGHHQSSSILAQEAFSAAADPAKFPEQLKYVKIWQARCILLNGFNGATASGTPLKIDIGQYNKLLGKGYGEIAAQSRSNHKSQGFGSASQRGTATESFSLWKGIMPTTSLMDGVETSWSRVPGSSKIQSLISQLNKEFDAENPDRSVAGLVQLLTELEGLKDDYWKELKIKEVKDLLLTCAGLWFESYADRPTYAVTDSVNVNTQVIKRSPVPVRLNYVNPGLTAGKIADVAENQPLSYNARMGVSKLTQPYYLEKPHPIGEYTVDDPLLIGHPENPDQLLVDFSFVIAGKQVSYRRPVVYKFADQVKGEIYRPLEITPPVTAMLSKKVLLVADNQPKELTVSLKSYKNNATGVLTPVLSEGWKVEPASAKFTLASAGDQQNFKFMVTSSAKAEPGKLVASVTVDGKDYTKEIKTIQYDHIPAITYFPEAEAKLVKLDLKLGGRKIGYLAGAGDLVPEMLTQVGYQVTMLTDDQVMNGDLSAYDAIVTGVRTYNVNAQMRYEQPKLLSYVENGGTLVVQYNVNRPLVMNQVGPYPFSIGSERVTEEDAKVTLLQPEHPLLNYPNKITVKDFDGWIQERGIYFPTAIDPKYQSLLSMADRGENTGSGSLIAADYGKGRFVYTSLVFFRELPAGVPGAYRLFVNLMAKKQ